METAWQYLKKVEGLASKILFILGLLIPIVIFLNRFLIPDRSFDTMNYHYFLGFRGFNRGNIPFEFFPTGVHNFSRLFDMIGYGFSKILGYRLGTVISLVYIYLSAIFVYKIIKLVSKNKIKIWGNLINTFLFLSSLLSFELYLQIATYCVDGLSLVLLLAFLYFWFKYLIKGKQANIYIASLILSVAILGKQTNLFVLAPFLVFASMIVYRRSMSKIKALRVILALGFIALSFSSFWYWDNYKQAGNPVFPFYNKIFKSKFYPELNYEVNQFGGRTLLEKIGWGAVSALVPSRLGEIHELFTDYKINIYFVFGLITLGYLWLHLKKGDKDIFWFAMIYLTTFLVWSIQFGYLRYGLYLEVCGGILIIFVFNKLPKKIPIILAASPLLFLLIIQNKKIVNMSLAYDLSFRPGYYYNRYTYKDNFENLDQNIIEIGKKSVDVQIYLNCSTQSIAYYATSPFNNLPVLNISRRGYMEMVEDPEYRRESRERILRYLGKNDGENINFVTIVSKSGFNREYENCLDHLEEEKMEIIEESETNFLGYEDEKLVVIYARGSLD